MRHTESKELKLELYKIAIETRNFEIKLFWQRSNYFLVLNTSIAVGAFTKVAEKSQIYFLLLGIVVSFLWFLVNIGSKYWQVRWEYEVAKLEKEINQEIYLFSANKKATDNAVKEFLSGYRQQDSFPSLCDSFILVKPSVSKIMICLSVIFVIFWSVSFFVMIIDIFA
ncbi:hypothetical protein NIES4102_18510 [Chondrocystis sp. NIES-4102]|nr:hypothetical protein NIES4102_18510 [Chondrocystis sp. NIES-4102]